MTSLLYFFSDCAANYMDGLKVSVTTTLFVGFILFNGLLYVRSEGIRLFSRSTGDLWTKQCVYFTPLRIFVENIDLRGDCPLRIRSPRARF